MHQPEGPKAVAGIRNFVWVEPGVLARGEQPPLTDDTFAALRAQGITAILSLRPHDEQPTPKRPDPYDVQAEQALAAHHGMHFAHAPMEDFSAPVPETLAAALETLDRQLAAGDTVYVHCRAGAGRASLVSGAWFIAHGASGDAAARLYEAQMDHLGQSTGLSPDEWRTALQRVGQPQVLWSFGEMARALGSPLTHQLGMLPPEKPARANGWEERYWTSLEPWRAQRPA